MHNSSKVTHLGPVPVIHSGPNPPGSSAFMPKVEGFNAQKVSQVRALKKVYAGTIFTYQGWKIIQETPVYGGRVDLMVTKGKHVAMIYSARRTSIKTIFASS